MSVFRTLFFPLALSVTACTPFEGARTGAAFVDSVPTEEAFPGARIEGQGVHRITLDDGFALDLPYVVQEGTAVTEGDIVLGDADALVNRAAVTNWSSSRWECTVPYTFSNVLDPGSRQDFLNAVEHWESNTGLRFVEDSSAEDVVVVYSGSGCSSYLGRIGGPQELSLAPNCGTGAAIHEIGHAVGLFHEQSRSDRDQHVLVHYDQIPTDLHFAFDTWLDQGLAGAEVGPYDLGSIMHYNSGAFTSGLCFPGNTEGCTITHLDGSYLVETQRESLSAGDIAAVAAMYPSCEASVAPEAPPVPEDLHGDSFLLATGLTGSATIDGFLQFDDRDLFFLDVEPGSEVSVWTTGPTDTTGGLYETYLLVAEDDVVGANLALSTVAPEGLLHVDVRGQTFDTTGPYTLHVDVTPPAIEPEPSAVPDDHGNHYATATLVPVPLGTTSLTAEITPGDVDVFRLDVPQDGMLWVQTSDGVSLSATLFDANGVQLAADGPTASQGVLIGQYVWAGTHYAFIDGSAASASSYAAAFTLQ